MSITNAKKELEQELFSAEKSLSDIVALRIVFISSCYSEERLEIRYEEGNGVFATDKLDFDYDSGYGGQKLFGKVLFSDGTWLERGEYDGSEWWEYRKTPTVDEIFWEDY